LGQSRDGLVDWCDVTKKPMSTAALLVPCERQGYSERG
jgi:hypothetical protein